MLECGKKPTKGGQNVYVQCVCTKRQLIVHIQKKREMEGYKGSIESCVKERGEMKSREETSCGFVYIGYNRELMG